MTQLALIPKPVKLTERQQAALDFIVANQPVTSEELGAFLHEIRMQTGGRGHDREARCRYCSGEGAQTARALRRHKLVVQKRQLGWCTPEYRPVPTGTSTIQAPSSTTDEHGFPLDY